MKQPVCIDIETTDTRAWCGRVLCLAAVCPDEQISGVWTMDKVPARVLRLLADPQRPVISHSTFDPVFLRLSGFDVTGPYIDTKVMGHLLNENTLLDLEWMSKFYCGITMDKRLEREDGVVFFRTDEGERVPLAEAPIDQVMRYCLRDTETTWALYLELRAKLEDRLWAGEWLSEHVPFTEVLVNMECAGIEYDEAAGEKLSRELHRRGGLQAADLFKKLGYECNLNSPVQLSEVLFSKVWHQADEVPIDIDLTKPTLVDIIAKRTPGRTKKSVTADEVEETKARLVEAMTPANFVVQSVGRTKLHGYRICKGLGLRPTPKSEKTGRPSTNSKLLMQAHPTQEFVVDLLGYRKVVKAASYIDAYPRYVHEGRLRGRFNQTGTVTGRLSSSSPNLMNIPAHGELGAAIRKLFVGDLIVGDHSQLEPRLMAHYSQDPVLLDIYRTGKDIYRITAEYIFGVAVEKEDPRRQICKTNVLALGYGAGANTIALQLCANGFPTDAGTAQGYLDEMKRLYRGFFAWREHHIAEAKRNGYVKTIGGRYRRLTGELNASAFKARFRGERQAVNATIQGSAADILRRNMLDCRKFSGPQLLVQVHDELVWELSKMCGCYGGHDALDTDCCGWHDGSGLEWLSRECEAPGYPISVPLKFEASLCDNWSEKGGKTVDLELIYEDEDEPELEAA